MSRIVKNSETGKNKILILGAAGFIGTNLTLRLLKEEEELILFDRSEDLFAPEVKRAIAAGQAQVVIDSFAEMTDKEEWLQKISVLKEVKTVYHLVSTTCPTNSNRNVATELQDNLISTTYLLDACVEAGVEKIVFLSSGGTVYGKEHTGICKEEEEAFPITVYGLQKLGIEKLLYLYHNMYGLDYRIVRLANPYGPYQRPDGVQGAVTTFTWRVLHDMPVEVYGDGSVIRDYIYIDDAIEGILKIVENKGRYRLYNLGSGNGHKISQVVEAVAEVTGKVPQIVYKPGRPVDVPINVLDIHRFKEDFGMFEPIGLKEGIRRLAAFYKQKEENI